MLGFGVTLLLIFGSVSASNSSNVVFYAAHSHNDYEQEVPLWTALDEGIGSIEADLHLVNGVLFIGHDVPSNITVSEMYLDPLITLIQDTGSVWNWTSNQPLNILFDLKTDGESTYQALYDLISRNYSDIFSYVDVNRTFHQSYLHCIITGNEPIDEMRFETPPHYCSIDNQYSVTIKTYNETFSPLTSFDFKSIFGNVDILDKNQLQLVEQFIESSRRFNKRLRFWGAPETTEFWDQLIEADGNRNVIVLNADDLQSVHDYLETKGYNNTNQGCDLTPDWCAIPTPQQIRYR